MSLVFPTRPTVGRRQAHLVRAAPSPTIRLGTLPLTRRGRPLPHRVTEGAGRSRCPGTDQPLSHAQWVRSSAVCGGQWLPCAWRDRRAGGGVVPHPRPPPHLPSNLAVRARRPCPAQVPAREPRTPRASPATLRGPSPALGPTSAAAAAAAPSRPRQPGTPRPARMQMPRSRDQWSAEPGPPCRAAASGREPETGRRAHRRAAPRGRGRRVPFRTSASGRGRHLPGGAFGARRLPGAGRLPRRRVVRPEALPRRPKVERPGRLGTPRPQSPASWAPPWIAGLRHA